MGSAMFSYVTTGEAVTSEGNSITEGIGNSRVTGNFDGAPVDDAVQVRDHDAVRMVYRLLHQEGLFLGSSSGINVCGAVAAANAMGPGHVIVTVLCDGGHRYLSRLFNEAWLEEKGLLEAARCGRAQAH